jgi:hypothetical protein
LLQRLLAVLEDWQWARLVFHLANVINGTGWGKCASRSKRADGRNFLDDDGKTRQ